MTIKKILITVVVILLLVAGVGLVVGPTLIDKSMNVVNAHTSYPVSDRAKQLHQSLVVGDWHADSLLWNRSLEERHDFGHVDLPRLQAGNVSLQMFTTVTKSPSGLNYEENSAEANDSITSLAMLQRWPSKTWNSLTERALYQASKLHAAAAANPDDLVVVRSQAELTEFSQRRQSNPSLVAGLLGTEGSHALDGELSNVQRLYDAGFRMMSLQHFFDNKLGGSLHGTSNAGLTDFGQQVVRKIESLNIVLDVSHSSEAVVSDVLKLASRPLVVSHTGFKGHCDTPRNISDSLMQSIAQQGGLIAVGYWDAAACGETPTEIVSALQYGLSLVGEDHLSLGSDFDGTVTTSLDTSELPALTHAMLEAGFSESQISKIMGGNMLRFLQTYLPEN
ncbi:dipeptidase [Arenicella xantha]|uniref:Microsomal dipeptidase-like Zn-dependent dipeptidase n=1 Tax=Arenicella xantha TaxID=644221 RepID=A0A395JK50_9GAMM|nr:dipeptidase [Arenicella xantha]RBP47081.1 microsomal dipeptidase-like Zn-dependent dipeptidase [Arenicella xantha]